MIFTGNDNYVTGNDLINQAVFLSNPAGPIPRQITSKRFRLAGSMKWVTQYFSYKCVNLAKYFVIVPCPSPVVGESGHSKLIT